MTTSPSKPSSSRSSLDHRRAHRRRLRRRARRTTTCAVITARTPASTAARNGSELRPGRRPTTGSSRCESCRVSPWPGKCLAQAATPAPLRARARTPRRGARRAPAPSRRRGSPITGLSGFVFTSATGAQVRGSTPTAASSAADRGGDRRGQLHVVDDAEARGCPGTSCRARPRAASRRRPPRRCATSSRAAPPAAPPSARPAAPGRGRSWRRARRRRARRSSQRQQPVRALRPGEAGTRQAAASRASSRAHPRTAPAVSPNAIRRCTSTKKTTTGSAVSVAAGHQRAPVRRRACVVKFASQTSASASPGWCSST